jgi:ActR/RegA family two-component response regulator
VSAAVLVGASRAEREAPVNRILLIDDDGVASEALVRLFMLDGYEVARAHNGRDGLRRASDFDPDVAVIDLRLPDMSGLDVLRQMRDRHPWTACVMVTGFGTCSSAVEAIRLGACDFLEKPVDPDHMLRLVRKAISGRAHSFDAEVHLQPTEAHSLKRWATVVVRAVGAPTDPRTLQEWGRAVGASPGAIRNWCRTARLSARRSLLLTRVLRAVVRQHDTMAPPEDLLNIVDRRTLVKLIAASGGHHGRLPASTSEFLQRQHLIDNMAAVNELRGALASMTTVKREPVRLDDALAVKARAV